MTSVCVFQWQCLCVGEMGCLRRAGHVQNRVSSAKRVGHGFFGQRVGHPLAVHYEAVFVSAGRQLRFLVPATASCGMQSLGFGLPLVESSGDANGGGRRMRKFKANGHEFGAGAVDVVMVFVVFHSFEFDWCLRRHLFAEHFRYDEDDKGSEKASASEEIYQGVTSGGKHGYYY